MEIFSVKEFSTGTCEYFANIPAIVEYLKAKKPIGNKYTVRDSDNAGEYDITADNLTRLIYGANAAAATGQSNYPAVIFIDMDFFIQTITEEYIIATVPVRE